MKENSIFSRYQRIIHISLCSLLFLSIRSNGQTSAVTLPTLNPPSANATALGIYGNYPISYTSGVPDINIPFYQVKSSKLSIPITLNYHANGIKVNELASDVGLGWTLNAGGAIVREINDLSDFLDNGFGNLVIPEETPPPLPGYNIHPAYDELDYYAGLVSIDPLARDVKYDGQPDNFFFNYASRSGQFMLKNTVARGAPLSFTTIPYTPVKINFIKEINRFTIQDTDGTTYIFGNSVKDNSNATEMTSNITPEAQNTPPTPTAWYLTEMISVDRTDTISFKYGSPGKTLINYATQVINQPYASFNVPSVGHFATYTSSVTQDEVKLSEIDYKNGKITFEYGSRLDHGANKLNRIRIFSLNANRFKELKRFNFNQSYFNGSDNSGFGQQMKTQNNAQRLRLDSISEEGINPVTGASILNPPYTFDYYYCNTATLGNAIAYLGVYEQDLWGYWNGHQQPDLFYSKPPGTGTVADRTVDPNHLIAGTIKTIQYPTGGLTEFQYEPNQAIRTYNSSDTSFVSYRLTTLGTYGTQSTDLTFTAQNDIPASLTFTIQSNCTTGSCLLNQPQVFIYDLTNNGQAIVATSPGVITSLPYKLNLTVPLVQGHQYRMVFPSPGGDVNQSAKYRLDATLDRAGIQNIVQTTHNDQVLTGGLRVKKIITKDFQNNVLTTKRLNYLNPYYLASDIFNGDFTRIGARFIFVQQGKDGMDFLRTYNESPTIPLSGSSNGSIAYQEVEEYNDDNSGNSTGKTVYDFNQHTDDNYDIYTSTKSNNSWKRNQLLEKRTYKITNGDLALIKDSKNTYSDLFGSATDVIRSYVIRRKVNVNNIPNNSSSSIFPDYNYVFGGKEFDGCINGSEVYRYNTYDNLSSNQIIFKNALTSTEDIDYDPDGENPVSKLVNYFYDNPDNLMVTRKEVIRSNHVKEIERFTYTNDYNLDQCNAASCYNNFLTALSNLKLNYYNDTSPVYSQWTLLNSVRAGIIGNCSGVAGCAIANHYDANDATILSLYNQYNSLKNTYNNAVKLAVNDYNSCQASYFACSISQINSAPQSVKALLLMQQANMLTQTEETKTVVSFSDKQEHLVSAGKNIYQPVNNAAKPAQTKHAEFSGDLLYSSYIAQPDNYLVTDMTYDNFDSGNLTQYKKNSGTPNAYIWGYNKQFAVAEVKNANATDIYYDSFEEGDGNTLDGDAQTGHYSFNGNYSRQLSGLTNGNYLLSYYKKSGNSWSLNTTNVTVANGSYSISLTGQIDDVRLHPSSALMSTYTYDPSIGMTSSTDPKNNTTYYEYDGMQRLLNVKDESRNIIKHMDYHYKQ